jgi:hypothetical protein
MQLCKTLSIVTLLRHVYCYPWNIKGKSFDNEAIVPNEIKLIKEMIKGNGPKKFLAMANRQKTRIIFIWFNYKTAPEGSHLLASSTGRDEDDTLHA